VESATLGADGVTALAPVLAVSAESSVRAITNQLCLTNFELLQWRFTRYCSPDFLLLAHILDPSRGVAGLCTHPGCYAAFDNIVRLFLGLNSRFGALPQGGGQDELQHNHRGQPAAGVVKYLADGPDTLPLLYPKGSLSSTTLMAAEPAALGMAAAVVAVLVWLPWSFGLCAQSTRARCCNKWISASSRSPATPLSLSACGPQWSWPAQLRGARWAPSD